MLSNFISDGAENFQHYGDQDVELDEDDDDPEADEVEVDPAHTLGPQYRRVLIDGDIPIVHDHLVEEYDEGGAIVIEVEGVVEGRGPRIYVAIICQVATEQEHADLRVDIEDEVDEEELAKYRFRNLLRRLHH